MLQAEWLVSAWVLLITPQLEASTSSFVCLFNGVGLVGSSHSEAIIAVVTA